MADIILVINEDMEIAELELDVLGSNVDVIVNEDVNISDAIDTIIGIVEIIDEVVNIGELELEVTGEILIINEVVQYSENHDVFKKMFDTVLTALARPNNLTRSIQAVHDNLYRLNGKRPWPVKVVPKHQAAHLDRSGIVHIDDSLKDIYNHLKALLNKIEEK